MFCKNNKKKSTAAVFLTIGALATIGAVSITKCGRRMIMCVKEKISGMIEKAKGEA